MVKVKSMECCITEPLLTVPESRMARKARQETDCKWHWGLRVNFESCLLINKPVNKPSVIVIALPGPNPGEQFAVPHTVLQAQ